MKIDINKIVGALILIIGHGFFFLNISHHVPFAALSIFTAFLFWMLWNKITNTLDLNLLFNLFAISGLIIALSVLSIFGIEPVGTRRGTLINFHITSILIAVGIFFITLLPYIIFNLKFNLPKPFNIKFVSGFKSPPTSKQTSAAPKYMVGDSNWEVATDDDIFSGDYNIE